MSKRRKFPGLLEYLERRLGTYRGNGAEKEFFCPFCIDRIGSESSSRKMWVNVANGKVFCFRCEYGAGGLRRLFLDLNGGSLRYEEIAILRGEMEPPAGLTIRQAVLEMLYADSATEKAEPQKIPDDAISLTQCKWDEPPVKLKRGIQYLKKRGVNLLTAHKFDIHFCPYGRYSGRLIFPVYQNGEQVYFTSRYAGHHERKTLNPLNEDGRFRRTDCLLNYDNVIGQKVVAVVEGPFDCMAHEHAVGLIAKRISETQTRLLEVLAEHGTQEFVVNLDPDAGPEADAVYRKLLGRVPKVTTLILDHGDPHDRRDELPSLMQGRKEPSTRDRVRQRLRGKR